MPIADLPFLAWALSVDSWDPDWPEATKRKAVADSIALHRLKGTPASVEAVLARLDDLLELVEWHEQGGSGRPNTFDVLLPLVTATGIAPGGERSSAAFADVIIREVAKVKPLREHMTLVQSVPLAGGIGIQSVGRAAEFTREDAWLTIDESPDWAAYLQTEDGEPIGTTGDFLDTRP